VDDPKHQRRDVSDIDAIARKELPLLRPGASKVPSTLVAR
jgi:hypothetical protein